MNPIKLTIVYDAVTGRLDFKAEPTMVSLLGVMAALVGAQMTLLQNMGGAGKIIGPDGTPLSQPKAPPEPPTPENSGGTDGA